MSWWGPWYRLRRFQGCCCHTATWKDSCVQPSGNVPRNTNWQPIQQCECCCSQKIWANRDRLGCCHREHRSFQSRETSRQESDHGRKDPSRLRGIRPCPCWRQLRRPQMWKLQRNGLRWGDCHRPNKARMGRPKIIMKLKIWRETVRVGDSKQACDLCGVLKPQKDVLVEGKKGSMIRIIHETWNIPENQDNHRLQWSLRFYFRFCCTYCWKGCYLSLKISTRVAY